MVILHIALVFCVSVAVPTWAQSCTLGGLETDTTVADGELAEGRNIYGHGDQAAYKCRPGYEQKSPPPNYRNATCIAGTWQYLADRLSCTKTDCERPKDPAHGRVIYTGNKTTVGSIILYACDHGGPRHTAYCLAGGIWSEGPPTCQAAAVKCEHLKDPPHGKAIYFQNETSVGSAVLFQCNYGSTRSRASCLPNGTWDSSPPICPEAGCEELKDPAYGKVIYVNDKTTIGSTILFRCDDGSKAYTARCQPGGVWSEIPPTCQPPPSEMPKVKTVTTAPRSKERRECPPLQHPPYGTLLATGTNNSSVTFACDEGYIMQGSATMICHPEGMWEPQQLPICRAPFPWIIVASTAATLLVIAVVGLVCILYRRRRPTGYRRQIRKPSASDSHTQNEVAHLHKPYPVTSL